MSVLKYINKVKANISIHTNRKTSNILDGAYNSIYKGKSMEFEDLREYVIGDNIKDIDWKASSRSNRILIKQFIAEKKHNVLFILDSGKKMLADTLDYEPKKDVALMGVGTVGYLVNKHGDSVGAIFKGREKINFFPFKTGLYNVERILTNYEKEIATESNLEELIHYVLKFVKKRMIIFIVTDIDGMTNISEDTLRKLSYLHDVMFINISDSLMSGENLFDIEFGDYIPKFFLNDKKLKEIDSDLKSKMYEDIKNKFKKYKISSVTMSNQKNVVLDILKLVERQKYANKR